MIIAANHMGYTHVHIVDADGQMIGGCAVGTRDDQIVEFGVAKRHLTPHLINETDFSFERILEPNNGVYTLRRGILAITPKPVVTRLVTACPSARPHRLDLLLARVATVSLTLV